MTQHVVATPSPAMPLWRRRTFLIIAGVVVLALVLAATFRAVTVNDSRTASQATRAGAATGLPVFDGGPAFLSQCSATGPLDGAYLLALVSSSANGPQMLASLSPEARGLVSAAAVGAASSSGDVVDPPDATTLFLVLARLGAADRSAVTALLPAEMQTELAAIGNNAQYFSCA